MSVPAHTSDGFPIKQNIQSRTCCGQNLDKWQIQAKVSKIPKGLQPANISTINKGKITAFFTSQSPLSNITLAVSPLIAKNLCQLNSFPMYKKSMYFYDTSTAEQVLNITDLKQARHLGKTVKNFGMNSEVASSIHN